MPLNTLQRYLNYLEQDKQNVHLLLSISDCYWRLGDVESTKTYLYQAKQWSNNPFGLVHLEARLLHHNQQVEEAIALLETSMNHCATNADAYGLLALLYFDINDESNAQKAISTTLSLNPNHPNGLLVSLLLKSLHNQTTPDEIESLLTTQPQESRLWFILGTTQLRLMNCPAAEQALIKATQLNPQSYDGWICLAWCHLLQNHLENAEVAYQFAISLDDDRVDGFGGLAILNALRNQPSNATHWLSEAQRRDAESFITKCAQMLLTHPLEEEKTQAQFNDLFSEIITAQRIPSSSKEHS